jgi:hypothetical protein
MSLKIMFIYINFSFDFLGLGPVYMEAGLARLARQPGKRDEFLLCLYEKISSRLPELGLKRGTERNGYGVKMRNGYGVKT